MKNSKHTPGPWTIHSNGHLRQLDPLGYNSIPRNDADKNLIAAAPELLEWIKFIKDAYSLDEHCQTGLAKVIAKAEGDES